MCILRVMLLLFFFFSQSFAITIRKIDNIHGSKPVTVGVFKRDGVSTSVYEETVFAGHSTVVDWQIDQAQHVLFAHDVQIDLSDIEFDQACNIIFDGDDQPSIADEGCQ